MAIYVRAIIVFLTLSLLSACGGGGGSAGNTTGKNLFTTATEKITLAPGEKRNYSVGGGVPNYAVTSSNSNVAVVTLVGTNFSITGAKYGTADVYISDSSGSSVKVEVTTTVNAAVFEVLPGSVTGSVGDTLNFKIAGGSPSFTITNNNESVATVSPKILGDGGEFTAKLLIAGTTDVSIVDAQGQVKTITITVNSTPTSVLRISPSSFTIGEDFNGVVSLTIIGGTGPFTALTSNLVLSGVSVSGATLNVDLGYQKTRCINAGTSSVILTIIDSLGVSATSTMIIQDNGKGGTDCS